MKNFDYSGTICFLFVLSVLYIFLFSCLLWPEFLLTIILFSSHTIIRSYTYLCTVLLGVTLETTTYILNLSKCNINWYFLQTMNARISECAYCFNHTARNHYSFRFTHTCPLLCHSLFCICKLPFEVMFILTKEHMYFFW